MSFLPKFQRFAWLCASLILLNLPGHARASDTPVLRLAVSFSILADLAREIGGERVEVISLVGANEDAHSFQPRPSDARRVGNADLVIINGLGFDDWMERLARAGGYRGTTLVASAGIHQLAEEEDAHAHEHHQDGHGHDHHGSSDPHAWQDVSQVRHYVRNIAKALRTLDPAHSEHYQHQLARYDQQLAALDDEIHQAIARLPAEQRRAVSSHDAFAYFSHAYGIEFLAPAGLASHAEASAKGVARLIEQLRRERVPAVFLETTIDRRLIERIAAESGARIGGTLYSDALSAADGPAASYLAMMRHNLRTIIDALSPSP